MSDRILVTGATGLQGSEMGSEKFSNSAKSGYNKGTIRSDIWYLVVSKDVRRHRLISIDYITVTAEVASSSLVVPAILFKRVRRISLKPSRARKGHVSRPFCALCSDPQSFI